MSGKPTVVSTFAGCGGSSLGYKWAGFHELLAIDFEPHAVETFKLNFPGVDVWQADIRKVSAESILERCGIREGVLDVLDGSPPCQGFSTAGKRKVNDTRNDLALEFVRLIEGLQPRAFVMENVSGMAKGGMRGRFNEILAGLKATGYRVEVRKLNAMYYGVPQSRERIIFIGMRDGQEIEWPKQQQIITVKDAIGALGNEQDESIDHVWIDESSSAKDTKWWGKTRHLQQGISYAPGHRVDIWNAPASMIITPGAANMRMKPYIRNLNRHPLYVRTYSLLEMKRLMSFNDEFKFPGEWWKGFDRLGNAVPPKMMQAIAECVKVVLDGQ